jgi:hypothetical protein
MSICIQLMRIKLTGGDMSMMFLVLRSAQILREGSSSAIHNCVYWVIMFSVGILIGFLTGQLTA